MNLAGLSQLSAEATVHLVAVALCGARLLPVAFLCPMFGGSTSPTTVKLSLVLALCGFLHFAGGVGSHLGAPDLATFSVLAGKELTFGLVLGLVAALPFDAARMGGRFIDLFRGSSAEAALPSAGTRESATGDGLYQLLVGIAATTAAMPIVLGAIFKSFAVVQLGAFVASESVAMQIAGLVGATFSVALAIGAPVAGASMAVDCLLGLVSRAAPQMNLQDTGAPLRILAGGAVTWLAIGVLMERLLGLVVDSGLAIDTVSQLAR